MAFGGLDRKQTAAPMADINMTPLIDVMLVLLVIFIITAPLFTHAIRLDLPKVASAPSRETPQTISLSIDAAGKLYWDSTPLTLDQLRARFAEAGKRTDPPEIHLRAERSTRYETIAQVMGAAQQAGLERIGFVTDPPPPTQGGDAAAASPGTAAPAQVQAPTRPASP
ncbi:ExbD/TolR family protein [Paraburkholderia saeva]|uniref:ExbD/TolR family protein n=1 Tax=Paraburkholderia saeva TaxID=2777537 RepID=UPI001D7901D4|nr:biopolymer transporter ExbD [Paraburkholderia saeva]CAG4915770.1 Tol-Pal system protein TolR [Paraburkholderia saeva]